MVNSILTTSKLTQKLQSFLKVYSTICFIDNAYLGLIFLGLTFIYPNTAICGLIALFSAKITLFFFKFDESFQHLKFYNSLLVGLSLGVIYKLSLPLVIVIIIGSILALLLTVILAENFWHKYKLPVLTIPFVLSALSVNFAAQSFGTLEYYLLPVMSQKIFLTGFLDKFLISLGSIFFVPHPIAGLGIFITILFVSRYLALLALAGYLVGSSIFGFLNGMANTEIMIWSGFNLILSAMAIGGIFTIPSIKGFCIAMFAAILSAFFTVAIQNFMIIFGLSVITIPCLLTNYIIIIALAKRKKNQNPILNLISPKLPETSLHKLKISKLRKANKISLAMPVYGMWDIYQGFDGKYTHKGDWRYAVDFYITKNSQSFKNNGQNLKDYYCFAKPVLSPVYGEIFAIENSIVDNSPGEMDTYNNWGNYIIIYINSTGHFVIIAHLKQNSIIVNLKDKVVPGDKIAQCGNSGRSAQPHIHMHLQNNAILGSKTIKFNLYNIIRDKDQSYYLAYKPKCGDVIFANASQSNLYNATKLLSNSILNYELVKDNKRTLHHFNVEVDLLGYYYLVNEIGNKIAIHQNENFSSFDRFYLKRGSFSKMFKFFHRNDESDKILKILNISCSLIPFAESKTKWSYYSSCVNIPDSNLLTFFLKLIRPLGNQIKSSFELNFINKKNQWELLGNHEINLFKKKLFQAKTVVVLDHKYGIIKLNFKSHNNNYEINLKELGNKGDNGIKGFLNKIP